ncbi:MAG: GTPase Era [Acetivibrionales bacterium]|jgi:GTP-binding protein Era|nr:GTPase Era [Clostridiaceae bacterium]
MAFKSGFITIIGRPNVGKSTLLNLLTGEKVAIMSNKPQTTRTSIRTVLTTDDYQMVFVDTPGMHTPKNKLGQFMMKEVYNSIEDVDVIIYMVEATDKKIGKGDSRIIEELRKAGAPVILVINKIDLVEKESLLPLIAQYAQAYEFEEIIPVSALNADTKNQVLDVLFKLLPEGELYYPEDMLTDQQSKVLAQELIREKLLQLLSEEVPHGIGIEIISFKEDNDNNVIYIDADIYCEKKSHKGIVIGKNGTMLKRVGTLARQDMENLFDAKVVLKLWVKVKDDWRNNDFVLNELGYKDKD